MLSLMLVLGLGSSPRVRGTVGLIYTQYQDGRFIPACAGNSAWRG